MTKAGATFCALLAQFALAPLAGLAAPGAAIAGPDIWKSFESRCIGPLEAIEPANIDGLVEDGVDTRLESYRDPAGFFTLERDRIVSSKSNLCRLTAFYDKKTGPAFEAWARMVIADGHYQMIENSRPSLLLESTIWREPRIQVEVDFLGLTGRPFLEVRETDLES